MIANRRSTPQNAQLPFLTRNMGVRITGAHPNGVLEELKGRGGLFFRVVLPSSGQPPLLE